MMKISMISEHASPLAALGGVDAGGQNVHVAALARALADRGHTITVFTRRDDPQLPDTVELGAGVSVVNITAGPAEYVPKDEFLPFMDDLGRGIAAYWSAHPQARPDIVHSHFWMSGLAARTALEGAGLLEVPLVHTFHALGTVKRRHQGALDTSPPARAALEPRVGMDATRIIATCTDEIRELAALGIAGERVSVVPCGVDLGLFRADQPGEDTGGVRRIVCVGRLVERKGVDLVIRALARLSERGYHDVELHIIGGGDAARAGEDPEAARLETLAADLGIADRVVLRGQVPRDCVPAILRSAALVTCTPWYEPFGIVPLEAMACGVPIVASEVGGLADTVVDGVTGLHVAARDPAAIADAAARLLDDPAMAAAMGRNGVDRVREHYSWPVVADATEQVYRNVTGEQPTTASAEVLHLPVPAAGGVAQPAGPCPDGIDEHLDGVAAAVASLRAHAPVLRRWSAELAEALTTGRRLFTAGNGGSAAEAQHLSSELVGRFAGDRPAFSALALSTDSSAVTAIANDYGYEHVFSRQLEAHAGPGDVLVLLTTSGRSANLLQAARTAARLGVRTWALTGSGPTPLGEVCDEVIAVEAPAPHVQEAHLIAIHSMCGAFEAQIRRLTDAVPSADRPAPNRPAAGLSAPYRFREVRL